MRGVDEQASSHFLQTVMITEQRKDAIVDIIQLRLIAIDRFHVHVLLSCVE